jgi:hypothetical protein
MGVFPEDGVFFGSISRRFTVFIALNAIFSRFAVESLSKLKTIHLFRKNAAEGMYSSLLRLRIYKLFLKLKIILINILPK